MCVPVVGACGHIDLSNNSTSDVALRFEHRHVDTSRLPARPGDQPRCDVDFAEISEDIFSPDKDILLLLAVV